jgi:hypothetical protein
MQLKDTRVESARPTVRWPMRPVAEYLAFATFASRMAPPKEFKPITKGEHWRL